MSKKESRKEEAYAALGSVLCFSCYCRADYLCVSAGHFATVS